MTHKAHAERSFEDPGYSTAQRWVDMTALGVFTLLAVTMGARVLGAGHGRGTLVAAAALTGYVAADLLSGMVHWAFDTWGTVRTRFWGPYFIRGFREHHFDQKAITRHDFVETNGAAALAASPPVAAAFLLPIDSASAWPVAMAAFVLATMLAMVATNQVHKWAHADAAPGWVRWLQRWHLVLTPEHHAQHHAAPHLTHYCITTGWLNGALNATRFFRAAERAMISWTGAVPRREDALDDAPRG
jgi:ubiquitin-conjugating enzyme E2 variant